MQRRGQHARPAAGAALQGARAAGPARIGRAKRWPWPATQPSSHRACRCGSLSTPSATTVRCRLRARSTVDRIDRGGLGRRLDRADELAVDLQLVHRDAGQHRQRGDAGAEVVEGQPDAGVAQLGERPVDDVELADA